MANTKPKYRKSVLSCHCKRVASRSFAGHAAKSMQTPSIVLSQVQHRVHLTRSLLISVSFVWILSACGSQAQRLNSERIERTFGSYGVEVIQASDEGRVSSLYSGTGEEKVTRTFAVVKFSGRVRPAFALEHSEIESGQSIGAVFKSAGWVIEKHNIFIGELEVPENYAIVAERMQIGLPENLATHVYLFVISNDEGSFNYATIVELHHPDYLSAEDLRTSYGEIIFDDSNRTSVDDFIDSEIWKTETDDIGRPRYCD